MTTPEQLAAGLVFNGATPAVVASALRDYGAACAAVERERCAALAREQRSLHGECAEVIAAAIERRGKE